MTEDGLRRGASAGPGRAALDVGVNGEGQSAAEGAEPLSWERAIRLFVAGWAADHPGIRPTTLGHYREQLVNRIAAFAAERGIASVQEFSRHDLRAFAVWLEGFVTQRGRPLTPRGKQMALATAKQFLGWLYHERLLGEDVATHVGTYRLDRAPEPRATPAEDLEKVLASLDLSRPTGVRNMAMIHRMAFCGLRVGEMVGLNADDPDVEEGRVRVKAETSKVRRRRFVDLPLTLSDGQEVVKPEVVELMASWLRLRSHACPHLGEEDALFVTLGPNQFTYGTAEIGGAGARARTPGERLATHAVRTILKRIAADAERRWAFARADITGGISLPCPLSVLRTARRAGAR